MRQLPTALAQKLDAGVTTLAQAWRLTSKDGLIVAMTQHDRDLSFSGTLFKAAQSFVSGDHEREMSLAPDRTALSGALSSDAITQSDLALGRWDGATIEAFCVDWTTPSDFFATWSGTIGGVTLRGNAFELDVVGQEAALNQEIGRVYARTCDASLGDGRCKVDLSQGGRRFYAPIVAVTSDRGFTIAAPSGQSASYFVGGGIELTGGIAQGWKASIGKVTPSPSGWLISLNHPFGVAPASGDTVQVTMGCDKAFATCKERFSNALNFRGQPTMPGDDVAFGGPAASGNNGGKR